MHCLTITFSFITNEQPKCIASQFPFQNEFLFHFKSFQSWAFFEQISQRVNVLEHFTKK